MRDAQMALAHWPLASARLWTAKLVAALGRVGGWPLVLWALLAAGAVAARPVLAPLETAALSVVWQAWVPGFAPPGTIDRPPLLVWLIHLLWTLFGVSGALARLVTPAFSLAALLATWRLGRELWPRRPELAGAAAIVLVGTSGFATYLGLTVASMPPVPFFALGLIGLARAAEGAAFRGFSLYATAVLFGCLSGGWAILLALLPPAVLAPWWAGAGPTAPRRRWARWYACTAGSVALAVALVFLWMWAGGMDAVTALGRVWTRAGGWWHRSWLWIPALLPLVLYPWVWWPTFWRSVRAALLAGPDSGTRFALVAAAAALLFALLTGNGQADSLLLLQVPLALLIARVSADQAQPRDFHALVPGLVALAIGLVAFLLNIVPAAHLDVVWRLVIDEDGSVPIWLGGISLVPGLLLLGGGYFAALVTPRETRGALVQLALLPALLITSFNLEYIFTIREFADLQPVANEIRTLQEQGRPVAYYGRYKGQFDFAGRLQAPLVELRPMKETLFWAAANPDGVIVSSFQGSVLKLPARPLLLGPVGDTWAALWTAPQVLATNGAVLEQQF
ncbi:MAG: glycosyltransferase family 39 protein [Rhodospirillaceae bacterium]|nr:glycosyltransferase family 39 protein [Rhodospirillaceae bacterium]